MRYKSTILHISFVAFAVAILRLCTQIYVRTQRENKEKDAAYRSQAAECETSNVPKDLSLPSLYELVYNDTRLSMFQKVISEIPSDMFSFPESAEGITLFAPVDEAFAQENFRWDLPNFYWMFLGLYHHVLGSFTQDDLRCHNTVPTYLWADIFQSYRQAMSVQVSGLSVGLNNEATIIQPDVEARDGHLHYIDRVLMLPNSTADITRNRLDFSLLREGLDETGLALLINDTSTHNGQTIFAPSNIAFQKLGTRINRFLFSQLGQKCLRAILRYHIIPNETLFTNSHFKANGRGPGLFGSIEPGSELHMQTMIKPLHVKVNIVKDGKRGRIVLNDAVHVSQPDIVVQDGVIHKIDDVVLPPLRFTEYENSADHSSFWMKVWQQLFHADHMTVDYLLERLQPYIDQDIEEEI